MQESQRASKKQRELLAFIDEFIKANNFGPSYREIMRGLGYKSVSTVAVHVDGLIAKGYLRKRDNSARSIEVVGAAGHVNQPATTHEQWLQQKMSALIVATASPADQQALTRAAQLLGLQIDEPQP